MEPIKREQYAKAIIESQGNKTQAYLKVHPDASYDVAKQEGPRTFATNQDIRSRAVEILEKTENGTIQAVLDNLASMAKANKAIVCDKRLVEVQDNATRMDAVKTVLKMYGALDERAINITQNNAYDMTDAVGHDIANELCKLNEALGIKRKTYDQDAEVIL